MPRAGTTQLQRRPGTYNYYNLPLVVCVFMCVLVGGSNAGWVNVAVRKPTRQVDRNDNSHRATDGDRNPKYSDGSCTHTDHMTNNWWVVDLLRSYDITAVRIQNRNVVMERLTDFYIYVSKKNPLPLPPIDGVMPGELCVHFPGTLPHQGIQELRCDSNKRIKGRFVYLWKPAHGKMTICEFEVPQLISDDRSGLGVCQLAHPGKKTSLTPIHSREINRKSGLVCCLTCVSAPDGLATHFQLNKRSGRCECIQHSHLMDKTLGLSSDVDFDLWEITSEMIGGL